MNDKHYEEITKKMHSDAKLALDDWIEWHWTPEKPYPETWDTLVRIKCKSDGYEETESYEPSAVSYWGDPHDNIWEPESFGSITHYKLA